MTYTAPDGYVMTSSPTETVTYSCEAEGYPDGTYESLETYPADTVIGIQQMQIKRTVNNNNMTIDIKESTDAELIAYIQSLQGE